MNVTALCDSNGMHHQLRRPDQNTNFKVRTVHRQHMFRHWVNASSRWYGIPRSEHTFQGLQFARRREWRVALLECQAPNRTLDPAAILFSQGYTSHAWGTDELKPLTRRGSTSFRLGLTIVSATFVALVCNRRTRGAKGRKSCQSVTLPAPCTARARGYVMYFV